jgi:hypothetical protein
VELFDGLHAAVGSPETQIELPKSFFDSPEAKVDEDLIALWEVDSWSRYGKGLFWTPESSQC